MAKGRAFLVVGHRHWGKSWTIRALTNNNRGWYVLNGRRFFVRLSSNDDIKEDDPDSYERFIRNLNPETKPLVIAAYCPEDEPYPLITAFAEKYDLFIFVLEHQYGGDATISAAEITVLQGLGTVEVYHPQNTESNERAQALAQFVEANVAD